MGTVRQLAISVLALLALARTAPAASLELQLLTPGAGGLPGGHCLDGSPAGYYHSASLTSDLWVIFLQGGGACFDEASCTSRSKGHLGSSTGWPQAMAGNPLTSDDCSVNPDFCNATRIFVPYCTGDVHVGQRTAASPDTWNFWFDGHLNFEAIVRHLLPQGLGKAKQVLLSGSSAGGLGTFYNADPLSTLLAGQATVKAAPQAGFFFPGLTADQPDAKWAPPNDWPHWSTNTTGGIGHDNTTTVLWESYGPPDCIAAQGWHCGSIFVSYPYFKTPMFILENQYDTNQLYAQLQLPNKDLGPRELEYIAYFGAAMTASVVPSVQSKPSDGVFLASCFDHGSGLNVGGATKINGYSSGESLGDWFFNRNQIPHRLIDNCTRMPCNPTCDPAGAPPACIAALHSTCGQPLPAEALCLACAERHHADLVAAKCSVEAVREYCVSK